MIDPTIDLREVDSPYRGKQWLRNIIDRFSKDDYNCVLCKEEKKEIVTPEPKFVSAGIITKLPPQYCPPEKEYGKLSYEKSDEIVKVYDRHEPNHVFLASRNEIEKVNNKLPYPNFIIKGSKEDCDIFEPRIRPMFPHPSNHDW